MVVYGEATVLVSTPTDWLVVFVVYGTRELLTTGVTVVKGISSVDGLEPTEVARLVCTTCEVVYEVEHFGLAPPYPAGWW